MKILLFIITFCLSQNLMAIKVDVYDYMIFEGDTLRMFNSPLEPYFGKFPEQDPAPDKLFLGATKQYTAYYELRDSILYLKSIYTAKFDEDSSLISVNVIADIFKGQQEVKMKWFSTNLIIGTDILGRKRVVGNQKDEDFFILQIDGGELKSIKRTNPRKIKKLKHQLFKEFSKTDKYTSITKQYPEAKPREVEVILGNRILDYTSKIEIEQTPHNNTP